MISSEAITLRSSIKSELMRFTLWRGTILACLGAVAILLSGIFLSPERLAVWGLPIFLGGMVLITLGLLPYKRLKRLETTPYKLILEPDKLYYFSGKKTFCWPWEAIDKVEYEEEGRHYGICLTFKQSFKGTQNKLFLPYFTKNAYQTLKNSL